jgi:hypothetical protein
MLPVPNQKGTLVPRNAAQTDTLQALGAHCFPNREISNTYSLLKVKAHTGVTGNECADVIAKHAALHNHGHDVIVPPPTPDGNPFSHIYWIAAEDAPTTACPTTSTKPAPLQKLKDKLKQHMNAQHRLGDANTDSGYYRWWMNMLSTANTKTSNTWTNSKVTFEQKRDVMQSRIGTLYNQNIAYRNGKATSPNCLLCQHTDSFTQDSHALWLSA